MNVDLRRLKAERVANGLTQDEMAIRMGWKSRTPYAKRELGLIPIGADELAKAAEILGYDVNSLNIFFTITVPDREQKQSA
ncbi:helix-turn-helix transcriptional regulator [Leuconostoc gelidum subsp. aenigmaticum]|uniref:helix-turn-helix domain-containing protein n=1 Tax=Leuconostoc gelidum TaxID=1244 RepID=UPI001CC5FEDB|nr:helix-turn-helix transcriptional regulator [Leuconostoc gelidum]MBZ6004068.1 helix-turn-helix transcriptional regulator [Leuconostoc gelidum subsp. aenigmaticum]